MNEAEKIAATEEEKSLVFAIQQQKDQYEREVAEEQTTAALQAIAKIRGDLDKIEKSSLDDVNTGSIDTLVATLENITRLHPRSTGTVEGQIHRKDTSERHQDGCRGTPQTQGDDCSGHQAAFSARNLFEYQTALKKYAQTMSSTNAGREYQQSFDENNFWQQGLKSNELPQLQANLWFGTHQRRNQGNTGLAAENRFRNSNQSLAERFQINLRKSTQ